MPTSSILNSYKLEFLQHVTAHGKIHYTYCCDVLSKSNSKLKMFAAQIFQERKPLSICRGMLTEKKKIKNLGETQYARSE
jgi:hypothetical protein